MLSRNRLEPFILRRNVLPTAATRSQAGNGGQPARLNLFKKSHETEDFSPLLQGGPGCFLLPGSHLFRLAGKITAPFFPFIAFAM